MPSRLPTDVSSLAKFIVSPECRSIAILTGAGISVATGIPDFRSPGGMYDTLRPELITATAAQRRAMAADPTAVVLKDMFFANAFPYLEVRRPFILELFGIAKNLSRTQREPRRSGVGGVLTPAAHAHAV